MVIEGDIVGLDAGARVDGYWCDYNRNFAVGEPNTATCTVHQALQDATDAGIAALRPGMRASDAWYASTERLSDPSRTTRYGHGVGLDLTEPPSIHADDHTVLREGMVLTIEPGTAFTTKAGTAAVLVHEEMYVVRGKGPADLLTDRSVTLEA